MVKLRTGSSLETVKSFPSARWAWLVLVGQGSRADFSCGQGVKHEKLDGQDFDPGRGWEYSRLCSVTPLISLHSTVHAHELSLFKPQLQNYRNNNGCGLWLSTRQR